MHSIQTVVLLSSALSYVSGSRCFYYARNELKLDKIFDYGLVNCPPGTKGCFYYPHRQCIDGRLGIAYSITGCLGNPDLCDKKNELKVKKLNGTARCCYYLGCNYDAYIFLFTLPRWEPQHDFDERRCTSGTVPAKIADHTNCG